MQYRPQQCETMGVLIWALAKAMKLETGLAGKVLSTPLLFEGLVTSMFVAQPHETWTKYMDGLTKLQTSMVK